MGRHSIDSAPTAPAAPPASGTAAARPIAPITDPVLLDAVQRDLRRLRSVAPPAALAAPDPAATRRVETPFSGPVDVPVENVIGPHRPEDTASTPAAAPRPQRRPVQRGFAPVESAPAASTPVASGAAVRVPAPRPVPARTAVPYLSASTGPVVVPTHRSAPVPVEAQRELDDDQVEGDQGPIGLSVRTLLLSTGIGLLASTALSLLTLIPR